MRRKGVAIIASLLLCFGCAVPNQNGGPNASHGFGSALAGIAHLILSPIQIAAGLLEGIASVPYYLSTNVHEINKGMVAARASITLDDTYDAAYGKRLSQVPDSGETGAGEEFRRMKHASQYFQRVLKRYGVRDAEHYILTSIDTANSEGYTLFAVVYRPVDAIQVVDKYDGRELRNFSREDRLFYEPFERDASNRSLDRVVDWAGLPRDAVQGQKAQAVLITMAANAVVANKQSLDYWQAERRWLAGDFRQVTEEKLGNARQRMNI